MLIMDCYRIQFIYIINMDKYESASNIFQRIYELFYLRVGSGRP